MACYCPPKTNLTGTSSMEYNCFNQRSWVASVNSKRDIALEKLRDQLSSKYGELFWSDPTSVELSDLAAPPTGNTSWGVTRTVDDPYTSAIEPLSIAGITPTVNAQGAFTNGYGITCKPGGMDQVFQLVAADGETAGFEQIKYISTTSQLSEIEAQVVFNGSDTDNHTALLSVRINGSDSNDAEFDKYPNDSNALRAVAYNDGAGADQNSSTLVFKTNVMLSGGDKIKLVLWKDDTNNGSRIKVTLVKLSIRTLP